MAEDPLNRLFHLIVDQEWKTTPDVVIERITAHPHEASATCVNRWSSLHWACCLNAPEPLIRALLDAHPHAASLEDDYGFTPLHYLCYRPFLKLDDDIARANTTARGYLLRGNHSRCMACYEDLADRIQQMVKVINFQQQQNIHKNLLDTEKFHTIMWPTASLLVKAAYHKGIVDPLPDGKSWRVVHACAALNCPPKLVQLAASLHPEQLREYDEDGNLPLHLSVARGQQWNCATEAILDGFPPAVAERDGKNVLFPFMSASVGYTASLDGAYRMLRACPELNRYRYIGSGPCKKLGKRRTVPQAPLATKDLTATTKSLDNL